MDEILVRIRCRRCIITSIRRVVWFVALFATGAWLACLNRVYWSGTVAPPQPVTELRIVSTGPIALTIVSKNTPSRQISCANGVGVFVSDLFAHPSEAGQPPHR